MQHFTYKIQPVDSTAGVPAGIGVFTTRTIDVKANPAADRGLLVPTLAAGSSKITENILIDPMTREIIDKVTKYNEDGSRAIEQSSGRIISEINDYWFEIKAKILWKDVPPEIAALSQKM
jgi:hypothetical protein